MNLHQPLGFNEIYTVFTIVMIIIVISYCTVGVSQMFCTWVDRSILVILEYLCSGIVWTATIIVLVDYIVVRAIDLCVVTASDGCVLRVCWLIARCFLP